MRRGHASIDQLLFSWRHHGRRAALRVLVKRLEHRALRLSLAFQYPQVEWGRNVQLRGKVDIRGSGTVVIGDGAVLDGRVHPVRLLAVRPDAHIAIGERSALSGTVVVAAGSIRIGRGCILATSRLSDNNWHPISGERRGGGPVVAPRPVLVGDNVWVADAAMITLGVTVGANSLVGAGAVIRSDVPPDSVVVGNPQRVIRGLEDPPEAPRRPAAAGGVAAARIVELIEEATLSVPGTLNGASRLDQADLWDSQSVVTFMTLVEDEIGLELELDDIAGCETVDDLARVIGSRLAR